MYILRKKGWVSTMYKIWMIIDEEYYYYGADADRNKANEIAMRVREERGVETFVEYDPD
jgi:hypothetical protein